MRAKRVEGIDIFRAFLIISVVAGHAQIPVVKGFCFIYMVPAFFFISGFCSKADSGLDAEKQFSTICKRSYRLWKPYTIYAVVYTLLHNVFLWVGFYSSSPTFIEEFGNGRITEKYSLCDMIVHVLKSAVFLCDEELLRPLWFLPASFLASLLFSMIIPLALKTKRLWLIILEALIMFLIGYYIKLPFYFSQGMLGFSFMAMGYLVKEHKERLRMPMNKVALLCSCIVSFAVVLILSRFCTVDMMTNTYTNPILLLLGVFAGIVFIFDLSYLFAKTALKKLFCFVGKNTLTILALHLTMFKSVTLMQIVLLHKPRIYMACYPVYMKTPLWTILYFIVGIILSVFVAFVISRVNNKAEGKKVK